MTLLVLGSGLITKELSDICTVIHAISLLIHARAHSFSLLCREQCRGPVTLVGAGKTLSLTTSTGRSGASNLTLVALSAFLAV